MSAPRVLVACEFSGAVRRAFRARGFDAWSCDLLPAEDGSPYHLTGDVRRYLADGWHLMIAHPPCTYLANSGRRWLDEKAGRWKVPTRVVHGREPRVHREAPGPDRWKKRSITYPGIAAAMAEQWGDVLERLAA